MLVIITILLGWFLAAVIVGLALRSAKKRYEDDDQDDDGSFGSAFGGEFRR